MDNTKYMNSYLAGVLLGLLLLATIYITGRGLGASGAIKSFTLATVQGIVPEHAKTTAYYQEYNHDHAENPLKTWLVFEVLGAVIGAFLSGLISNRLGLSFEHGPHSTTKIRVVSALAGGLIFGFGAQLGRGCTSGAALSGMAVLSTGGIITMLGIFGGAYAFAWFFRKFWI
jgi:uncharacterized membrane protein YedE/YeeE